MKMKIRRSDMKPGCAMPRWLRTSIDVYCLNDNAGAEPKAHALKPRRLHLHLYVRIQMTKCPVSKRTNGKMEENWKNVERSRTCVADTTSR